MGVEFLEVSKPTDRVRVVLAVGSAVHVTEVDGLLKVAVVVSHRRIKSVLELILTNGDVIPDVDLEI